MTEKKKKNGDKDAIRATIDGVVTRVCVLPKPLRLSVGVLFLIGGCFAFLPILGVWMIPAGLLVLSVDIPWLKPWVERTEDWMARAVAWVQRRTEWKILARTLSRWSADRAGSMAASIAFYTIFSLAPTLLLVSWVAGVMFDNQGADAALTRELAGLIGPEGAKVMTHALQSAVPPVSLSFTAVIGLGGLLVGATTVFIEINSALNIIWRTGDVGPSGILAMLKSRLAALSLIAAFGFLLIVSLAVGAGVTAATHQLAEDSALMAYGVEAVNTLLSLALTFVMFGLIYKILPTVHVPWRRVWFAALTTALLFTIGKSLIGIYIGNSSLATTYGAASAFVIILLWVYYSVMIFLFGAELSAAHAFVMDAWRRERLDAEADVGGKVKHPPRRARAKA